MSPRPSGVIGQVRSTPVFVIAAWGRGGRLLVMGSEAGKKKPRRSGAILRHHGGQAQA